MTDLPPTEKSLQEETGRASTLQLKLGYYLVISNRNELSQGRKKRSLLKGVSGRVELKKQNQQKIYIKRFIARTWLSCWWGWPDNLGCRIGRQEGQAGTLSHGRNSFSPAKP